MSESRLKTLYLCICLIFITILLRALYWQVEAYFSKKYVFQNTLQKLKYETSSSTRANLTSSFSFPWATNTPVTKLSFYKPEIANQQDVISYIKPLLNQKQFTQVSTYLQNPNQKWLEIQLNTLSTKESPSGVKKTTVYERKYPQGDLAKNIIGKVDENNTGLFGLEKYYNQTLTAYTGYKWLHKDGTGNSILGSKTLIIDAKNGEDIQISLDPQIQSTLENNIKNAQVEFDADRVLATIMDSKTGQIIGMASTFNSQEVSTIPNTQILYEPGSILKPIVIAWALKNNKIGFDHRCTVCSNAITIDDATIGNWDGGVYPNSDIKTILKNSDNIAMSQIGLKMGEETIGKMLSETGMDSSVNIDLPGTAQPFIKNYWSRVDVATAAFGQGVVGTQLNFLKAFNILAHGKSIEPHLKITSLSQINVLDEKIVNFIHDSLQYATKEGAVKTINKNNLDFCGKSGTAQIAASGKYVADLTNASYIGFYPCNNPKITFIVTVMKPRSSPWGATTAAPVWIKTVEELKTRFRML